METYVRHVIRGLTAIDEHACQLRRTNYTARSTMIASRKDSCPTALLILRLTHSDASEACTF
jgi:hypothetical protein